MARNFAIGGPTAREGQLDRFFFAKMAFHIQIVSEKAYSKKVPVLFRISGKGPGPFSDKLSQQIGGAGKTTFFGGVLPVFCPVLCFFH